MPKKIQKKTATPPPKLALGGRKSPLVGESSSGSIDRIIKEHMQHPTIQTQGNLPNIYQAPNRISILFNDVQSNPYSRSSSPDLESTPRPLRVLKGRKSFLSLNSGAPPRTTTPTPQGFKPKSMPQSPGGKPKGSNMPAPRQSPPARSFLGLRLTSPKPRALSTVNLPPPQGNLEVMEPKLAKLKPAEVRFSLGTGLRHPQASNVDLTRQSTMSSASTVTSSNSIMARPGVSHWINWRHRSISDGPSIKARSIVLDKGPSRAIKVVQPSIIYESMRHVESELEVPTPVDSISPRMLRRASSAGPGFFSLEQGISSLKFARPLTPRPPTLTNIEGSGHGYVKVDSVGKSGVFSKVLCSIQDMSPLSGNRVLGVGTTAMKNHSLRQSSESRMAEATTQAEPTMSRRVSLSERPELAETSTLKSKGTLKARGALGSIRRRFGSVSERTLKNTKDAPGLIPKNFQPHLQKEWVSPPILQLQLDIHSESSREHIEGGRDIWICIEVEGRISSFQESPEKLLWDGDPRGLDVAIVLDLSAHASPATFEDTKLMAKHLINSLSIIDNVSLTAFTSIQSSPGVETKYPLSKLTQSNKQQLFDFIDGLFGQAERQGTIRRDVKSILMGVIDDLKESTGRETFNESGRTSHLFFLTSILKNGDMPARAFESSDKRIKVHILGVGPLVTLQERPWKGSWIINLAPSPVVEACEGSEILHTLHNRIPALPHILDSLRHAVNFGELTNIQIGLSPCDGCRIVEVLGDTTFDSLVPGEKRTLFVKLKIGSYNPVSAPGTSMNTPDKNKDHQIKLALRKVSVDRAFDLKPAQVNDIYDRGIIPEYKLLERQLAATLGDIETRALTVSVSYEHEYFGAETVITTTKVLKVQRYDGDGNWSLSRNSMINSSGKVFLESPEDCEGSICSTDLLIPTVNVGQEPSDEHYDGDVEYVRTRLAKKIAEMTIGEAEENPRKALRMVEGLGIRGKGVYAVASELEWRVKIHEEEEETERIMKGLAEEISRKATRQPLAFEDRSNSSFSEQNVLSSNLDCTPSRGNNINLHLSGHYQEPGSLDASEIEMNQGIQQNADIAVCRPRDSSIVIYPVTLPSSPSLQFDESDESDPDDTHNLGREEPSEMQSSRCRRDHMDEAGRIWRELAETKMGLRRDIRPGRHRTPTLFPPMSRHSRHNSIDLWKDKYDKERTTDLNWTFLTSSRVKGKKKERRRKMKKQAMTRRSVTREGGLRTGYQTLVETDVMASLHPECGADQEAAIASKIPVCESKKGKDLESISALPHIRYEEHNILVTESQDASISLASHVQASISQAGNNTNNEQSNRDTMKSLITLRDIKETDFSPWAC